MIDIEQAQLLVSPLQQPLAEKKFGWIVVRDVFMAIVVVGTLFVAVTGVLPRGAVVLFCEQVVLAVAGVVCSLMQYLMELYVSAATVCGVNAEVRFAVFVLLLRFPIIPLLPFYVILPHNDPHLFRTPPSAASLP